MTGRQFPQSHLAMIDARIYVGKKSNKKLLTCGRWCILESISTVVVVNVATLVLSHLEARAILHIFKHKCLSDNRTGTDLNSLGKTFSSEGKYANLAVETILRTRPSTACQHHHFRNSRLVINTSARRGSCKYHPCWGRRDKQLHTLAYRTIFHTMGYNIVIREPPPSTVFAQFRENKFKARYFMC